MLLPDIGTGSAFALPPSAMRWVLSQPDSAIGSYEFIREINPTQHSLGDARYISDPWQGNLVKTHLNPMLDSLCDAMNEELQEAFDAHFGVDTAEWKEIDLYDAMSKVVMQAASRFTVGTPLCSSLVICLSPLFWTNSRL